MSKKILTNKQIHKTREGSPSSIHQMSDPTNILDYLGDRKHCPVTINIVAGNTENITINQNTNNVINAINSHINNESNHNQNINEKNEQINNDLVIHDIQKCKSSSKYNINILDELSPTTNTTSPIELLKPKYRKSDLSFENKKIEKSQLNITCK